MAPLPPLRDGGCALPICPFGRACHPLISDAPDCKCSPGRLRFWVVWAICPGAAAPISIHAPRGGAAIGDLADLTTEAFQSTRPVWGATMPARQSCGVLIRISIHAPRVGRDHSLRKLAVLLAISIHAPRVGRDTPACRQRPKRMNFNPRAPCGARLTLTDVDYSSVGFQSTRPVWGATCCILCIFIQFLNFNPRAPCGARLSGRVCNTLPRGISIHAPRVGRDDPNGKKDHHQQHFNPRAPCGARQTAQSGIDVANLFQSTRPVWGATVARVKYPASFVFQSTRPVWGATRIQHSSVHDP